MLERGGLEIRYGCEFTHLSTTVMRSSSVGVLEVMVYIVESVVEFV